MLLFRENSIQPSQSFQQYQHVLKHSGDSLINAYSLKQPFWIQLIIIIGFFSCKS